MHTIMCSWPETLQGPDLCLTKFRFISLNFKCCGLFGVTDPHVFTFEDACSGTGRWARKTYWYTLNKDYIGKTANHTPNNCGDANADWKWRSSQENTQTGRNLPLNAKE